jgi:2-aminoadipate transaminase
VLGVPFLGDTLDLAAFEKLLGRDRPKLAVLTPNFQNPTGLSLPLAARHTVLRLARAARVALVENDIYGELRYAGDPLPALKQLDETGDVIQLKSFSKIAFPGLRVGWVLGPAPVVDRLAQAKQWSDLHADHLAQAVLLRFAESGRLERHRARIVEAGAASLRAVLAACASHLPSGTRFTRPQGGMNLWVRLPEPLDSAALLDAAERRGVTYLPGRYFAVSRSEPGALRLSFAGLEPAAIEAGVEALGRAAAAERSRRMSERTGPLAPAVV